MLVVVPVDPPSEGVVLSSLVETTSVTESEAVALYEAAVADVLRAVDASGGDLLLNYRDRETMPDGAVPSDADPEAAVRALATDALGDVEGVRFERQVGSSRSARVGNTVTHLLEREDAGTVGVLEPTVPLVGRAEIDAASMSLRRYDVVIGPSSGGRTYFAGFTEPIDFTDVYEGVALSTLAGRAGDAGLDLGFSPFLPTVTSESGLCATLAEIEARRVAERPGAEATAAVVDDLGLGVGSEGALERAKDR
ncbi:hypothetical protein [Natrarchaeobius oligotrophus]|uniref:DUF2064 domain-containing protein n=1 Tax=Natrarchaeobius chitinivorans TaxID=1679083 RepID=A0A3N6PF87_NATCH|nr:hypothetical protein [Natrarchaeobius chitinivorans]RQG98659.1 hypothetical protein EA472_16850 [Natrarchaeobius chitinivorans]